MRRTARILPLLLPLLLAPAWAGDEGADEVAKSWGYEPEKGSGFWLDKPEQYAAAHQIDQGKVTGRWTAGLIATLVLGGGGLFLWSRKRG